MAKKTTQTKTPAKTAAAPAPTPESTRAARIAAAVAKFDLCATCGHERKDHYRPHEPTPYLKRLIEKGEYPAPKDPTRCCICYCKAFVLKPEPPAKPPKPSKPPKGGGGAAALKPGDRIEAPGGDLIPTRRGTVKHIGKRNWTREDEIRPETPALRAFIAFVLRSELTYFVLKTQAADMDAASAEFAERVGVMRSNGADIYTWWVETDDYDFTPDFAPGPQEPTEPVVHAVISRGDRMAYCGTDLRFTADDDEVTCADCIREMESKDVREEDPPPVTITAEGKAPQQIRDLEAAARGEVAEEVGVDVLAPLPVLSPGCHRLFVAFVEDAGNWSGQPLVGGNIDVPAEDKGRFTHLKKAGLLLTDALRNTVNGRERTEVWVSFTPLGQRYARAHRIRGAESLLVREPKGGR